MNYCDTLDTPLGMVVIQATNKGLTHLNFQSGNSPAKIDGIVPKSNDIILEAKKQIHAYFDRRLAVFDLPLQFNGTMFQQSVWQALCQIPFGTTWSYKTLAEYIDKPKAVRAVGAANGKNTIALIVPCHRVIGSNNTLTGYAGGLALKRSLLNHEMSQDQFQLA